MKRLYAVLALLLGFSQAAWAQDSLTVASFGGRFQDAQRKAYFLPFEKATGIKVVEASYSSAAQLRAMEMSGNVEWDLFEAVPTAFELLLNAAYLEKIDYAKIDNLDQFDPRVLHPYGMGALYFAQVVAYNTKSFPGENHPRTWSDVWDVAKYPGKRVLPAGNWDGVTPYEMAVLADGVQGNQLYPIDFARAFKMFTAIRPSVIKWVNTASSAPQALVDGEADLGYAAQARIAELKGQGAPVDWSWDQGLITSDYWAIPKGARRADLAMKFINFVSQAAQQAELVKLLPFGPTNKAALKNLPEDLQKNMPSYPANLAREVFLKPEFWTTPGADGRTPFDQAVKQWNQWVLQ
jgi:putative spermidine/putrescine transport system substrate-binding protein